MVRAFPRIYVQLHMCSVYKQILCLSEAVLSHSSHWLPAINLVCATKFFDCMA